jgi:hypothetical protein
MYKIAMMSPDGRYRYALERRWGETDRRCVWIMLNPSTADADVDDPTIRRCMGFSREWGYDGMAVVNLFAYRATDPKELRRVPDPQGPENYRTISEYCDRGAPLIVAAWGNGGADTEASQWVCGRYGRDAYCLGTTSRGEPRHPLYVRSDTILRPLIQPFSPVAAR